MSDIQLVSYHTWLKVSKGYQSAIRSAFVKTGRKWLKVVMIDATSDGGMRVWKVPLSDQQFMTPLMRKGKPYPVSRALKIFKRVGKTHGITKAAKNILKEAKT